MMVIGYELPINKFFKYIFHNLCHRCVSARTVNINIFSPPRRKTSYRPLKIDGWKMYLISFWDGPFSVDMSVCGGVTCLDHQGMFYLDLVKIALK